MEDKIYNKLVGQRIYAARKSIKLSMKELGLLVKLHESTVSRYEKGDIKTLDIEKINDFAKALNTTPAYLMGWDENTIAKDNITLITDLLSEHNIKINDFTEKEIHKIIEYALFIYNQRKEDNNG